MGILSNGVSIDHPDRDIVLDRSQIDTPFLLKVIV